MKLNALLFLSSFLIVLLSGISCAENAERQGRILNSRSYDAAIEQQFIQEFSANETETTADDVIEEIINSNRQGRNIDGLDEVYGDLSIKEALNSGNEVQARNLIRDKLCSLGLMQCDEVRHPTRIIYSKPPPGAIYNNRPPPQRLPSQQQLVRPVPPSGIYGPAKPMPIRPNQPPRKVGYVSSDLNAYETNRYSSEFYEVDPQPANIKFGYTEKPTIVVNQGKREANAGGVSQNHHVHHHYVHVDGSSNAGGLIDGTKTVLVNTPISEYSAANQLTSSYQTSGFGTSGAASSLNGGFSPVNGNGFEYKGVNSVAGQGIYSGASVKPVYESNQYASGSNYNKYSQNLGPATFTEGSNGVYSNGAQQQQSFHSSAPDFYKKELNLNGGYRGNGLTSGGYASQQQGAYNTQKYQQQQQQQQLYNKNQFGEQYGFESQRQDQLDCVCVPLDQCPAHDVVGRRDDLILPLDPRNLGTDIEADSDNSTTATTTLAAANSTATDVKKISKREVASVKKVDGEEVSIPVNISTIMK
jgi:hypothetical protein